MFAAAGFALGTAAALSSASGATATGVTVRTVQAVAGGGTITSYKFANGDSEQIYDNTGAVTTKALDPNTEPDGGASSSSSPTGSHGAGEMITPVTLSKAQSTPTNMLTAEQTVALLGGSAADQAQFKSYDASNAALTAKPVGAVAPNATITPATIHRAHTCVGHYYDGNRLHIYMCYDQYIVKEYGADWYLLDKFFGSGTMHDSAIINPDEITGLKQGVHYTHTGNSLYTWTPRRTYDAGHCATETLSLTIQGAGYTQSIETCPETWGLYYVSHWTMEEKWDGKGSGPSQGARDTAGMDGVHNPPSANATRSIIYYVWWE